MSVLARYLALVAQGRIRPDAGQSDAARRLDRLADEIARWRPGLFRRTPPPRGLYLWGDVGRGKSMLMDMFFAAAKAEPKRRVHFGTFMTEAHGLLHEARRANIRDPLPACAKRLEQRLLCFDEFLVEDVADAMILGRLFEQLLARGTVIAATSNTAPDRLYWHGLNRQLFLPFIASIQQRMDVVHLGGTDHRRGMVDGDHYRTGPDSRSAMDEAWLALGGDGEHMRTLAVLGRALTVPRALEHAARFCFAELCEAALGAADYVAVAEAFATVLIDDIPVFSATRRDGARRFTTLIDTLYDRRVRLICSAAAEPDALWPEGDAWFLRTVSRLLEMRSDTYIAGDAALTP